MLSEQVWAGFHLPTSCRLSQLLLLLLLPVAAAVWTCPPTRSMDEARLQFFKANRAGAMKKVWDPQDTATAFWSA